MEALYKYVHDEENRRVFRFPSSPEVTVQRVGRNKKTIWHYVRMRIDITRADNVLTHNQWLYPTMELPNFTCDDRYGADEAAYYFMRNYSPRGVEINEEQYKNLSKFYGGM